MKYTDTKNKFEQYIRQTNKNIPETFFLFANEQLPHFIQEFFEKSFLSIYECTDFHFYEHILLKIATDKRLKTINNDTKSMIAIVIKYYISFLHSKYFPRADMLFEGKAIKNRKVKEELKDIQEVNQEQELPEGSKKHIEQERSWRNPKLRQACIAHYGYVCQCCGFDFNKAYGEDLGKAFIEVHHLKPISSFDDEHLVNPIKDLVPLCSNCHAMIHRGKEGPLTLRELREKYQGIKWEIPVKMED